MDSFTLTQRYETMELADQLKHLLKLSFNLTVVARNTYMADSDDVGRPKALRGIVEICHKTIGRIQSISTGQFVLPAADFCRAIFGTADMYGCLFELESAIEFSSEL